MHPDGVGRGGLQQRRLPDPGLTEQEQRPSLAVPGPAHETANLLLLLVAAENPDQSHVT